MLREERRGWSISLLILAFACGGSCGSETAPSTSTVTGAGGTSGSVTTSTGNNGGQGGEECPPGVPDGVPEGWVRLPGAPCACDVFMSPDAEHMNPAAPWVDCGDGCQELAIDWTTSDTHHLLADFGASAGGIRHIALTRYLDPAGPTELQIVRLPDNEVVFDAIRPSEYGQWLLYLNRATPLNHYVELIDTLGDATFEHRSMRYLVDAVTGTPSLSFDAVVSIGILEAGVSADLWAVSLQGAAAIQWHGIERKDEMHLLWQATGGGTMFGLRVSGKNVFFGTWGVASEILVWDEAEGVRELVGFGSKRDGGACCLETDGEELVWFQGSEFTGGSASYADVKLMASPFATHAEDLEPRELRPAFQMNVGVGGGVVGSGYAAHKERVGEEERLIVTRLSDGYYWVVPPRDGFHWYRPLYVDDEEIAITENRNRGFTATHWTIVRRTIASLGVPQPPGSGF